MDEVKFLPLDTSDVGNWVGRPVGTGGLKEPVTVGDIRRWAQAMHNPNPLHYDERFAASSHVGRIVAPQSFAVACDVRMGTIPALQGSIAGSHMLFGGDEWWFYGPRIEPGDHLTCDRLALDFRVVDTRFAGPTALQRGDTTYINQRGEIVARQRSTAIRYLVENAQRARAAESFSPEHEWSDEELAELQRVSDGYTDSLLQDVKRSFDDIEEGEPLPDRVIGPHSIQSFAAEYRAYLYTTWGAFGPEAVPTSSDGAGWVEEMSWDTGRSAADPSRLDGLYHGAGRGHVQERYARLVGMPRGYGYGASMGAWLQDYVANWAGSTSLIRYSKGQLRHPALVGDIARLSGTVTAKERGSGAGLVQVQVEAKTQNGEQLATTVARVEVPLE